MCLNLLVKDRGEKYEVQAVMYEELAEHAKEGGFMLYALTNDGTIEEKLTRKVILN